MATTPTATSYLLVIITIIMKRKRSCKTCSASNSSYCYTFLHSVVCLSVICRIRAPCLNRLTDLDAIWQEHLWGPLTHYVRWGKGYLGVKPQPNHQSYAATWQIQTSDSAFCQITLVFVIIII